MQGKNNHLKGDKDRAKFNCKIRKNFLNALQKFLPDNFLPLSKNLKKKRKDFSQL